MVIEGGSCACWGTCCSVDWECAPCCRPCPEPTPEPPGPGNGGGGCNDEYWCSGNISNHRLSSCYVETTDCNASTTACGNWVCNVNSKIRQQNIGSCTVSTGRCSTAAVTCGNYPCPYGCATSTGIGNCYPNAVIRTTPETSGVEIPAMTPVTFSCNDSIEPECGNASSLNPSSCTFASCTSCTCSWTIKRGGMTVETLNGKEVSYAFTSSGTYTVELNACDEKNLCVTGVRIVNVANTPPVADFVVIPSQGLVGKTVFEMNASASYDPDGTIVNYAWDFGDGNTANGGKATHEKVNYTYYYNFTGSQDFNVTLTVQDNSGNSAQASKTVTIRNNPPRATFSAVPLQGVKPLTVIFKAVTKDDDGHDVNCFWDFERTNNWAGGCENIYTYYNEGQYAPRLRVVDLFGADRNYDLDVLVYRVTAITGVTAKNTKVRNDTVVAISCTEAVSGGNVNMILENPGGAKKAYQVPCSMSGAYNTIPGSDITVPGIYKVTVIAPEPDCVGIECSKSTSFNAYEEAEVETPEMNIVAVVAIALFALLLVRLNNREASK